MRAVSGDFAIEVFTKPVGNDWPAQGGLILWQNERNFLRLDRDLQPGMAVTIDVGDSRDLHPPNKYDVGLRLARLALARDYGRIYRLPLRPAAVPASP